MEITEPFTVTDIALAARHPFDMAGVDQQHREPARLENLEERDPVHPGRFHRHRAHPTGDQPVSQPVQVRGERLEGLHRVGIPIRGDGDIMFGGATVDPCRIRVDALEDGG